MCIFHKWSGWSKAASSYNYVVQHSVCESCGVIKWRKIGHSHDCGTAKVVNDSFGFSNEKG